MTNLENWKNPINQGVCSEGGGGWAVPVELYCIVSFLFISFDQNLIEKTPEVLPCLMPKM